MSFPGVTKIQFWEKKSRFLVTKKLTIFFCPVIAIKKSIKLSFVTPGMENIGQKGRGLHFLPLAKFYHFNKEKVCKQETVCIILLKLIKKFYYL